MVLVDQPIDYVRQICFGTTSMLPVYYYMEKAKLSDTPRV